MAWLLSRQNILTNQPYKTDKAFQQLTSDFNEKRLERFICSQIGCIWDVVPIHNFFQNLIKFQDTTNATVHIVQCNELATRPLRNGSNHSTFVQELQSVLVVTFLFYFHFSFI